MNLLIRNIRLLNPDQNLDSRSDLLLRDGVIARIAPSITDADGTEVRDGSRWVATPGFFDMHIHLREPGQTSKETIETGCAAAANGGFTGVCCMPNTTPAIDSAVIVQSILARANSTSVDVHVSGAITKGRLGEELAPIGELYEAGVRIFTDDGDCVASSQIMRRAFEYMSMFDDAVMSQHCEDHAMTRGFAMNEGPASTRMGLPGYPAVAEELIIARDIQLAEYTGGRPYHVSHMSTRGGVEHVRAAKRRGVASITCEVTPHHFVLRDDDVERYGTNAKMNPPLRGAADIDAILEGLRDGTIDVIATDHAPHTLAEKEVEFTSAPNGIVGLETAVGLSYTYLVDRGVIDLGRMVELMSIAPRRILSVPIPRIEEGAVANMSIIAPDDEWTVDATKFLSRSRNTPFNGWKLKGKPIGIVNKRRVVWSEL
jgi:dihydroorotase